MKANKSTSVIAIALQGLILLLLVMAQSTLGKESGFYDDYWRVESWIENCQVAMIPPVFTMVCLAMQLTPSLADKKSMKFLTFLTHGITIGYIMYIFEDARYEFLTPYYCGACAVAALSCSLPLNPWLSIVSGGILTIWGGLELFMDESIFDYSVFSLLILAVGAVLLIGGLARSKRKTVPKPTPNPEPPKPEPPKPEPPKPEPPKPEPPKPEPEPVKPTGKFCRHCGAKVEANDLFCVECGNKL